MIKLRQIQITANSQCTTAVIFQIKQVKEQYLFREELLQIAPQNCRGSIRIWLFAINGDIDHKLDPGPVLPLASHVRDCAGC